MASPEQLEQRALTARLRRAAIARKKGRTPGRNGCPPGYPDRRVAGAAPLEAAFSCGSEGDSCGEGHAGGEGEVEGNGGGNAEAEAGGDAGGEGGGEADADADGGGGGKAEGETDGGGEGVGEAQPTKLDLLGLADVVLEKIMASFYVPRSALRFEESFAMFQLLRVEMARAGAGARKS